jgi:hypothetical protein
VRRSEARGNPFYEGAPTVAQPTHLTSYLIMIRPLMGLRGTTWVVALLVAVVVALVLLFCAIVLSTQPTPA